MIFEGRSRGKGSKVKNLVTVSRKQRVDGEGGGGSETRTGHLGRWRRRMDASLPKASAEQRPVLMRVKWGLRSAVAWCQIVGVIVELDVGHNCRHERVISWGVCCHPNSVGVNTCFFIASGSRNDL